MTNVHSRLISDSTRRRKVANTVAQPREISDVAPEAASLRLQVICIVATLFAASIFTLTEHDDHRHTWWCAFEIAMQMLLVIVGTVFFRTRQRLLHDSSVMLPALVMVVTLSLLCEPVQRIFLGHGHPFEVLVMHSQSNLMLALAVCGFRITFQRLAMLIAVFLVIFSCTISNARGLLPLTILFAMSSLTWLVAAWWETVHRRLADTERYRRPLLWLAAGSTVPLLLLLTAAGFGTNTVTSALRGFMPSSGGTGQFDPFSRGGVNDGDALVAGNNNIKSFAPLEDAPFLDSEKPSLYDVFDDTYDEPPRKIKDQQRAIALPPDQLKHVHQKMADAKQAGREFSLLRSETQADSRSIQDLETHALFYVAGRVPARFRMEVYEHFDGITWYPLNSDDATANGQASIKTVEDRPWFSLLLAGRGFEMFSGSVTHSLKIANLQGNVIPSPPHLVGVSINQVDRKDMYRVSSVGIVSLNRKSVPEMTPINVVSECVDRSPIAQSSLVASLRRNNDVTAVLPDGEHTDRLKRLAQQWTLGIPRGWSQVEAIEAKLSEHCQLDRDARVPEECESPMTEFLFNQRRGPEYLFASSAACLLRSLGYSARMVSGFYAAPDNYDARKQHTAVFANNAHFWCEVFIGADAWVTVDSSPGYERLTPPPSLITRLWNQCVLAFEFALAHRLSLISAILLTIVVLFRRRHITEYLLTCRWRWLSPASNPNRSLALSRLIDYRLSLIGLERRPGTTLNRWSLQPKLQHVRPALRQLSSIADEARFSQNPTFDQHFATRTLHQLRMLESQLRLKDLRPVSNLS